MLFEVDTAGDSSARQRIAASRADGGDKQKPKLTASQKRKRLVDQERNLAALVFQVSSGSQQRKKAISSGRRDGKEHSADVCDTYEEDDGDGDDDGGNDNDGEEEAEASADEEGDADALDGDSDSAAVAIKPAWEDEDDAQQVIDVSGRGKGKDRLKKLRTSRAQTSLEGSEYAASLRRQFESVQPDVSWAALPEAGSASRKKKRKSVQAQGGDDDDDDDDDDETDEIMRSAAQLLGASGALPPEVVSVRRLLDLNKQERCASIAPCVQWHPNGRLALVAGPDKTLRLFRTDGSDNPKLQSVHLPKLPIHSAAFSHDGSQVYMVRHRPQSATTLTLTLTSTLTLTIAATPQPTLARPGGSRPTVGGLRLALGHRTDRSWHRRPH